MIQVSAPKEALAHLLPRRDLSHVIFDFDGTLSWLRHGWPRMMCEVFFAHGAERLGGAREEVEALLLSEILALNGRPSIHQSARFVEMMQASGADGLDAAQLRDEFQRTLDAAILRRAERIRSGEAPTDDYLVCGARAFLDEVSRSGLVPVIVSTTIEERVKEEAALLGIAEYFGRHIYGGTGDPHQFSKRAVFERVMAEEGISGLQLLSFGDGPVELRVTRELGGCAIGICSDEERNGSGALDPHKHSALRVAGAEAVLPDFRGAVPLLHQLLAR